MDEFTIGTDPQGLSAKCVARDELGRAQYIEFGVTGTDLSARLRVWGGYERSFEDLQAWAASLSADWRGWKGSKRYESLEHDLVIDAEHNGHIQFDVTLEQTEPFGWKVSHSLSIDAGEGLSNLVDSIARVVEGT